MRKPCENTGKFINAAWVCINKSINRASRNVLITKDNLLIPLGFGLVNKLEPMRIANGLPRTEF